MDDGLTIREAEPGDFAQWIPLWDGYNEFYGRVGPTAVHEKITQTTWARFFDPEEPMHALVAEHDGKLVGLVHYLFHRSTSFDAPICYLEDLFTSQTQRGKGIGRRLIESVCQKARAAGSSRVYWHTYASNETARRLYDQVSDYSGIIVYRIPL
jgi:GNAT superfamily N-acetyltransferase